MSENRRSTDFILRSAYSVISHNPQITSVELPGGERWEREPLRPMRQTKPEPEPFAGTGSWHGTSADPRRLSGPGNCAHARDRSPQRGDDFAVLYRNHSHRDELVEQLLERDIPFAVTGIDLLETLEVRDMMAALRAVIGDDPVSLLRVAALPLFNVNGEEFRGVLAASAEDVELESALEKTAGGPQVITTLLEARHDVAAIAEQGAGGMWHRAEVLRHSVFTRTPKRLRSLCKRWRKKPRQICGDGTLSEFLEYLEYFVEVGGCIAEPEERRGRHSGIVADGNRTGWEVAAKDDAVRLLTVHAAKGLEFPVVFVMRVTQRSFPSNTVRIWSNFRTSCGTPTHTRGRSEGSTCRRRAAPVLCVCDSSRRPAVLVREEGQRQRPDTSGIFAGTGDSRKEGRFQAVWSSRSSQPAKWSGRFTPAPRRFLVSLSG